MNDGASNPVKPPPAAVAREDTVLDWARGTGAGDLLAGGLDRYLLRQRRRRLGLAAAACAMLLAGGVAWFPFRETASITPTSPGSAHATVLRPEQRTLPDGSTVDLNAGAEIQVAFTDTLRRVVLRRGEAHFQVTRDALRPFVVAAGAIEVRAVGTAFAVDLGARDVDVLVTEGRVAVNTAATPAATATSSQARSAALLPLAALGAGGRIVLKREPAAAGNVAPHVSELSAAAMQTRMAWRVPRLKFTAAPLAQVVAMFNEHAARGYARLALAPDVPSTVLVSGTLRADDVDSLLRLLAGEFGISAETRPGEIILHPKK